MLHEHYPTQGEIDSWCANLLDRAENTKFTATPLNTPSYSFSLAVRHTRGNTYIAFESPSFDTFYGYWQPVPHGGPAPLLVHVPGYGAELSTHPELVAAGFNVLHVNPQGYGTPTGPDESKKIGGEWPVMAQTVGTCGQCGYVDWLRDALVAVGWARSQPMVQPGRLGFFGTSQGGGGSLLLGSLLRDLGARAVAADLPFLTNYPLVAGLTDTGAYRLTFTPMKQLKQENPASVPAAWKALGFVDTMSHVHRLTMPVMLTAGTEDTATPVVSIKPLFEALPGTRSYTELAGQTHAYTVPFLRLAEAWFGMYV